MISPDLLANTADKSVSHATSLEPRPLLDFAARGL
jgi:hypothetical protein